MCKLRRWSKEMQKMLVDPALSGALQSLLTKQLFVLIFFFNHSFIGMVQTLMTFGM